MEYRLKTGEKVFSYRAEKTGDNSMALSHDGVKMEVEYTAVSGHHQYLVINGLPLNAYLARDGNVVTVIISGTPYVIEDADVTDTRARGKKVSQAIPQEITPPMPAVVVRVLVCVGDRVKQGDKVAVVSSMKMETTLTAPSGGTVRAVNVAEGDKVMPGQVMIDIDRDSEVPSGDGTKPG